MGVQYMICHWAINRKDPQNSLSTTLDVPLHAQTITFMYIRTYSLRIRPQT